MIARAIVAGEDLKMGDALIEKKGRAHPVRESDAGQEWLWLGFAKEDTLKGGNTVIVPELNLSQESV